MIKRQNVRLYCKIPVEITKNISKLAGVIENIGAGGCRICGEEKLYLELTQNDIIILKFIYENTTFEFFGKVSRDVHKPFPIGIQFIKQDIEEKNKLDKLIKNKFLNN